MCESARPILRRPPLRIMKLKLRRISSHSRVCALWALLLVWDEGSAAAAEPPAGLVTLHRAPTAEGGPPFVVGPAADPVAVFRAVVGQDWRPGLVPLFTVEKEGRHELRRLPGRGQENFSEPLFFALPPEDEPEATSIAGRWDLAATRDDGSKVRVALELACEGERVAGRFDQLTDYRFATITAGSLRTNRLELRVEHVADAYVLAADWRDGRWLGRWRRADDTEGGELVLSRRLSPAVLPVGLGSIALHECRRSGDQQPRYLLASEPLPSGWERAVRPLCRVWRADAVPGR